MRLVLILAALALSGCSTPCIDVITEPTTRTFGCTDGSSLVVTFNPSPAYAHVVQEGYPPLDLPSDAAGSGYRYAQGGAELKGRMGSEGAAWTRPGARPMTCVGPTADQ